MYEPKPMAKREDRMTITVLAAIIAGCLALLLWTLQPVMADAIPVGGDPPDKAGGNPMQMYEPICDEDATDGLTIAGHGGRSICYTDGDCDDGNTCTLDACDEGSCTNVDVGHVLCPDDGRWCNGTEFCIPVPGPHQGWCDSTGDPCPAYHVCDEDADTCVLGECLYDYECDDGLTCTLDTCETGRDGRYCDQEARDWRCPDDGLFCNGEEYCDLAHDCCSCGNPCERGEVCDEETDTCANWCQDGDDCDDGIDCTYDICDPHHPDADQTGCLWWPHDDDCDDGNTCTVNICDLGIGCLTAPRDCSDGDPCTIDTCSTETACAHEYRHRPYGDVYPEAWNSLVDTADVLCVVAEVTGGPVCAGGADIAGGAPDGCGPNWRLDTVDILAVIAAAQGALPCPDPCPLVE